MRIKQRIILSSFVTVVVAMLLMFGVFYFFAFSKAKEERVAIFKSNSITLSHKFNDGLKYYNTIVKKYAPSKEFIFLLNDNYFVSSLSVNSSKKLINEIKNREKAVKKIYIFNKKHKELFNKKTPIDIKKLLKQKIVFNKKFFYVYSYIDNKNGILVFEVELDSLKNSLNGTSLQYYIVQSNNKFILSSQEFKNDLNTKFLKEEKLLDKGKYFYYFAPLGDYMLGTKISKKFLFKRIDTVFWIITLSIFIIVLLSMIQTVKASSLITSSIDKLTAVLGKNRDGKYAKIELKGDAEIEYFAQQYNDMIERISNFTEELEDKVKARTVEVEKQKEELKILSQTDTLTGVYNRNKLNEIVIGRQKYDAIYSIIIMDIDDFKVINDTHGHKVGDEILKEFADILKSVTRKSDFLGRWGGEEFIIICSDIKKDQALAVAEKIREKVEDFDFYKDLKITASFGVAQYTKGISYDELFVLADSALFKAKRSGKNKVVTS